MYIELHCIPLNLHKYANWVQICLFQITEDLNTDPELDSDHFMNVLIESLSLLGKIPEALEVLKKRIIQLVYVHVY